MADNNNNGVNYLIEDDGTFNLEQTDEIDLNPTNPEGPDAGTTGNVSILNQFEHLIVRYTNQSLYLKYFG